MGGIISTPLKTKETIVYSFKLSDTSTISETKLDQVKKPVLKRTNSHPDMTHSDTIFAPYEDIKLGSKSDQNEVIIQRHVTMSKHSLLGEGKFNYKHSEFFLYSTKYPWLLKNAHFLNPKMKEFGLDREIGAGRTATVILAKNDKKKYFVIKRISKDFIFQDEKNKKHVIAEREALYEMNSPFCMKLFAEFEDRKNVYFALEYVPGGELRSYLRQHIYFPVDVARFYLSQILCAVEHIQRHGYIFRDLRPENIVLDEDGHIKLVDFGSCIRANFNPTGKLYTICCPPGYLSPEQLDSKFTGGYSWEVDWWAFGIVAYELLQGVTPFRPNTNESQHEVLLRILQHKISYSFDFDGKAKDLIQKILHPKLDKRLKDAANIKKHSFFAGIKKWSDITDRKYCVPILPPIKNEGDSSNFAITEGSAKHWKLSSLENKFHLF